MDDSPEGRVAIYREYVRLAKEHFGDDERGHTRLRPFLVWHLGLWCRHIPRRADGSYVPMQERAVFASPSTPLEALLARPEPEVHEWIADRLMANDDIRPADLPPTSSRTSRPMRATDACPRSRRQRRGRGNFKIAKLQNCISTASSTRAVVATLKL